MWRRLKERGSDFTMEVSFMEIYREKVRDLLSSASPSVSLRLREHPIHGPMVQGLTRVEVGGGGSESEGLQKLFELLWEGERRRASGTNGSNRTSSRSHAVWTIHLTHHGPLGSNASEESPTILSNHIHLVDLAGR